MTFDLPAPLLAPSARILDAGGWFEPFVQATHVVDVMPYETRGGRLQPGPLPGERFAKNTWHQADFMGPGFRLPYPDKFFDFSVCGHTLEDLPDPRGLLGELRRVSRAGYIETPSRLSEQTAGRRDRMTGAQGHPHHHWIVEAEGRRLLFSSKAASLRGPEHRHCVPLRTFESLEARQAASPIQGFRWDQDFDWDFLPEDEAARRAEALVRSLRISPADRALDRLVRGLRGLRHRLFCPAPRTADDWWQEMLALSRPYSTIPL